MAHRWGRWKIAELPERQSLGAKHMKTTLPLPAPTLQRAHLKLYPIDGKAEEPAPGCSQPPGFHGAEQPASLPEGGGPGLLSAPSGRKHQDRFIPFWRLFSPSCEQWSLEINLEGNDLL